MKSVPQDMALEEQGAPRTGEEAALRPRLPRSGPGLRDRAAQRCRGTEWREPPGRAVRAVAGGLLSTPGQAGTASHCTPRVPDEQGPH
ncbi:hypothetical protein NDU88_002014 [Pleurodeles waltl]|uniref:Uncharacterized protein n=1 Tax=Pleurodeles waltl TaxID=8319 RepID=A0AAV7M6Z2_PLEWA|nr:hypothetical protein NDU88_002014 [Pleurodeles waltl]